MVQVTWSEHATHELENVCRFIARDSPARAEQLALQVAAAVARLVDHPRLGRTVPEIGRDDTRELLVQSYRVIYRLIEGGTEILTIHHGARRLREVE